MSATTPEPEHRDVPTVWVGLDEFPINFANAFVCQFQAGEFVLSVGQIVPPMLLGAEEERRAQLEAIDFVPIRPITRVALTRRRMVEFIEVLQENLASHDQVTGGGDQG